ncbi:MAG: hypothetical protein VKJ46_13830 [Leptolyngbyaceae bacterium]|nr:hypothetical protein [Leptolyngbyaceae bacterium]
MQNWRSDRTMPLLERWFPRVVEVFLLRFGKRTWVINFRAFFNPINIVLSGTFEAEDN